MQSSYRRGLISTSLDRLAPIGKLASSIGLSGAFDQTADFAVRQYQQHLSPRKGFCCAYAKLHGGPSCSTYFRDLLTTKGFTRAIQPFQRRLQECHQANLTLRAAVNIYTENEDEDREEHGHKRNPNNAHICDSGWDIGYYDVGDCGCDLFDVGVGECEVPDCDASDCNMPDCDLSNCDLSGCDCGGCDF